MNFGQLLFFEKYGELLHSAKKNEDYFYFSNAMREYMLDTLSAEAHSINHIRFKMRHLYMHFIESFQ